MASHGKPSPALVQVSAAPARGDRGRGTPMTNRQPAADASALSWSLACARVGWVVRSCDTRRIRGFTGSPLPAPHVRSGSQYISIASPRAPSPATLESARKTRVLGYERSSGPPVGTPGPSRVRVCPVCPGSTHRACCSAPSKWMVDECIEAGSGDMG